MKKKNYVIGIDGGGTKTIAVISDFDGKILKKVKTGSTNPNKIGFKRAIFNLKNLISKISQNYKRKVKIAYLGLAGGLERDREKKEEIERRLQKSFPFKIVVDGDQKIAFRTGTNEKNGIVLIAGTGSIAMGWKNGKEEISGGWDWLIGDQGSAFWVGRKVLEEIAKSIDGREKKLKIKDIVFKKFKIKNLSFFYKKFYAPDFVEKVALISKIVDRLSKKGDKFSKEILIEAAKELSKMTISVIRKLNFQHENFPMVLVGGMFKSEILREKFKKEIKKVAPKAKLILLKKEPVLGAVKMAIAKISKRD